jgi:hypothetical protein
VFDIARQLHFIRSLEHFSKRLDELLDSAHLHQSQLPPELIDEIAFTTGELMLVMTNHPGHHEDELINEVLTHARSLRDRLRVSESQSYEVAKDCDSFRREIAQLLIDSKKAASEYNRSSHILFQLFSFLSISFGRLLPMYFDVTLSFTLV